MNFPLEGNSIANNTLQYYVVKDIYKLTSKLNPMCSNHEITNTQVVHYPYDVKKKNNKYVKGYWKELWTVNSCGKKVQIPVSFYINNKSTTYILEDSFLKDFKTE